ncbi:MAG: Cna B-type domain-containing protein, partial [Oscillospiraceae bacterium]|nr:Cna B-type domain-containing protein [Oscillospiraceae bacterium]
TITFYDNNNQVISEWGTDTKAVKFEIKFNSSVDTAKLRYLKVNYQTTANTRAVIVAENAENKTTAWFGNQAEFDGESKVDQGFEFNRYPADYVEKVSIKVNKNWPNLDPNSQSEVQVQLYQKLTGSSEWQPYDDPVSLSKDNYWTYTWNKLPKTNENRTVEYLYKVVEDEVAGFRTSYSTEDGINSGEITVTNSLIPYADKVYVSATGEKADGSKVQLSELAKETINGTAYYIMQWKITPNPKGGVVTDTLPDDWTLLEDANDSVNKYGPFAGNGPYYQPSIVGWTYNVTYQNNGKTVTFDFMQGNYAYILYYLKIPVSKLEEKITSGSYAVENTVKAENGESDTVTITLTKQTDSNLLSKNAVQSEYPGLMTYQIILNPDGKNLANGDTIDVTDYFDLENFVSQYNPPSVSQMNVNLESISVHYLNGVSVGTDGEMTPDIGAALNSSQYQYTVGYKETETIIADYELVYTKDANNHPYWYVTSCVPGDEVTMILNTTEQNGDGYLYKPDWSGIPVQSKSYDSEKQQLTLKFTVPDGVTSLIINKNVDVVTAVTATAARDITPTAKLSITVPDETPLVITYDYQMTGYEFLPNELGTITASNEAMFNTGNAQRWDAEENMEFEVDTSHGTISGNSPPKI